ncbi:MAG: hypothetical protein U0231_16345 [Nitrospiraceae bacterium]
MMVKPAQDLPYIASAECARHALCDRLESVTALAIDTEFMGEDHFMPRLELIQVAADGFAAVIDFPAVQQTASIARFWALLCMAV